MKPTNNLPIYPNVLIIAPDAPGLNAIAEVDTISELGYNVRVLQGDVSDDRLYRAAQDHQYDILLFSCHGTLDALGLSGGARLSRNAVLQVARMTGARIVFLNTCDSIQLGQMLINAGLPAAISSIMPVEDETARQTSRTFFTILAQTGDISMAYKAACAGGDIFYVMLTNGTYASLQAKPVLESIESLRVNLEDSHQDRKALHDAVNRLTYLVALIAVLTVFTLLALELHTGFAL